MDEKLKVLIVDDEKPAVEILTHFVNKVSTLELVLATTNSIEAIDFVSLHSIDLIFLDIQMPDMTGIEFVNALDSKPMIVFTTAFSEYALKGFDLDVVDYLLKPIRFSRFLQAVNKATSRKPKVIDPISEKYLTIKVEYKTMRILLDDINYIEGCKDYVKIFYGDKMVLTRLNLKSIFAKLPHQEFERVHRSYIISISKVISYQKQRLEIGEISIPIGDQYKDQLLKKLSE